MLIAAFTGNWNRFLRFQDKGLTFFEEWTLYLAGDGRAGLPIH